MRPLRIVLSSAALLSFLSSTARAQDNGATIFKSSCQMCHGADGKGDTPTGKAFKVPDFHDPAVVQMSDADLEKIITAGKGKMPAFGTRLTAPEIQSVVSYIRVLQKQ